MLQVPQVGVVDDVIFQIVVDRMLKVALELIGKPDLLIDDHVVVVPIVEQIFIIRDGIVVKAILEIELGRN